MTHQRGDLLTRGPDLCVAWGGGRAVVLCVTCTVRVCVCFLYCGKVNLV